MSFLTKCFIIFAIFALLIFFIAKTIKIYFLRKKYSHLPGPPANGILGFYLGNLKQVIRTVNNNKILCDLMVEWVKLYGPVFKFQILDKIVVFTIDPDGVKETYITENFSKIPEVYTQVGYPYNERFLGHGLITDTDTTRWRHRRSLFNPGFHRHCLMSFLDEVNSKGDILLERLRTLADGKTVVNLFDEVNHAALDIIASIAFGMNVDSINDPSNELNKNVYESLKGFYRTTFDPFIYYKPNEWGFIINYRRILRKLRKLGQNQILKRLKLVKEGSYVSNDMLTNLLKSHESERFDIEDMIDDFLTFFVAGQETTANTLAFSFLEIAKNPDVLIKLREELNEVLGSRSDITNEDLGKLHYTSMVYKETLRLWPPIPEIARLADKDFTINNHFIPKGSWVEVSTYVSSRQEEYFEDPYKFKPERFEKPPKNYTYFPFSLGPRNCIGQNFAQMIGKVFIAKIIKNFDIKLDPTQNFGYLQEATLRPAGRTRCFLLPRVN